MSMPALHRPSCASRIRNGLFLALPALALLGCGEVGAPNGDVQQVSGGVGAISGPPSPASTIAFQTFNDDVGTRAATENRALIRSARGYQAFFGHAAPADLDFSNEWVMFYAAGTKPTTGYEASFLAVLRAGGSLFAITSLASPGASCGTAQAQSTPYALIKFPAQVGSTAQFFRQDETRDCPTGGCAAVLCPAGSTCDPATGKCSPGPMCGPVCDIFCPGGNVLDANGCPTCKCNPPPTDPCAAVTCATGTHCDSGKCVADTDPCAAVLCATGTHCDSGKCVADTVSCGGLAGKGCPGLGKCVDDPNDGCDPTAGGADCGGMCQCVQNVLCTTGNQFDSSPGVCACVAVKPPVCPPVCAIYCQYGNVPDANGCPTCKCNPPPTDPCATVKCASGTHCDSGKCVADTDPCATVKCASGTHCDSGKCVSDGVSCGGLAGKACPGAGKCVDNPNDGCDPKAGGADCIGICSCASAASCPANTRFDSSPSVCACVAVSSDPCPPEKCPTPAPKVASMLCADGSTAGPVCALAASGACGWTITTCPAL